MKKTTNLTINVDALARIGAMQRLRDLDDERAKITAWLSQNPTLKEARELVAKAVARTLVAKKSRSWSKAQHAKYRKTMAARAKKV